MSEAGTKRRQRKERYKATLVKLLQEFKNVVVVGVDNVGSLQMQKVRVALRGKATMLMGKNTMMRMVIREQMVANPKLEALLPAIRNNIGLVFTNGDMGGIRNVITAEKVPAAAKSGTAAPNDVFVPPGPTGLDPGQTGFFQALNIPTKIVKGAIEIISQVHLVKKGDRVTSSAVALLAKLDIKPFFYGITVLSIYEDGSVYPASVLDYTQDDLLAKFMSGVGRLRALSIGISYPSQLTLGYSLANAFRRLLALSFATDYKFAQAEAFGKAAAAGAAAAKSAPAGGETKDAGKGKDAGGKGKDAGKSKKEEKKAEPEPEPEDEGPGVGSLFGD
jgi:large subunit ribosomal protein LP0